MKITLLALSLSFSIFCSTANAQDQGFVNLKLLEVVGDYPAAGTDALKADLDQLVFYQVNRTEEQCAEAQSQATANLETFFGGKNGILSSEEINKVKSHLRIPLLRAGTDIELLKLYYKRERPYITHSEIKPCIELEKTKAYPSGHAALSRMYARILSNYFPERKELLMKRADKIALNRVLGGVHHPSDIVAGKKLGDYLADAILVDDLNADD